MAEKIQLLVSAVDKDGAVLAEQMHIGSDAVIVNQCGRYGYEEIARNGHRIQVFAMAERGVGLSRNTALLHADADICVFSDEDIVLCGDYQEQIRRAYAELPDADMILVNVQVAPARRTYWNEDIHRINYRNYGRYPAYSITARHEALLRWTECALFPAFRRGRQIQQRGGQPVSAGLSAGRFKDLFPHHMHRRGKGAGIHLVQRLS